MGFQTLGRAKEVGEFVKHGAKEAQIEIELQKDGIKYKQNLVDCIQCCCLLMLISTPLEASKHMIMMLLRLVKLCCNFI